MKRKIGTALAALLLLAACVSSQVPEEATYEHRYYAAVADYTLAKVAAERYVQLPSTSLVEAEAVLEVVECADAKLADFEELRQQNEAAPEGYARVAAALKTAAIELRRARAGERPTSICGEEG